jgi:large subunit ribosomal protein L15
VRLGFEGGQLPIIKRLPRKRGFVNIFKVEYNVVNVGKLGIFPPQGEITPTELLKVGLIKSLAHPTKILGAGDIHQPLLVKADRFSAAAQRKIVAAGGKVGKV